MSADRNYDDVAAFMRAGAAGEVIFSEGDKSRELFVVRDGRIQLLRGTVEIAVAEPGDVFGEWSFFEGHPREMTAKALDAFRVIALDKIAFDRVTSESPEVAARMLQKLAQRVRSGLPQSVSTGAAAAVKPAPVLETPAAASSTGARLVSANPERAFVLSTKDSIVGRADPATGYRPDVDLSELDTERTLSRRHARIVHRGDALFVREDTVSRNGTFVNGHRLDGGAEIELHDGDEVLFGLVKLTYRR